MTTPHIGLAALLPPSLPTEPYSWPTVFWRTSSKRCPAFRHLATRVTVARDRHSACSGHTIWRVRSDDGDAGLAWDWIEIANGVVAMVDPMQVSTNLQLVNAKGKLLSASEAALHYNQYVHRLRWQEKIRRLLQNQ